MSLTGTERRLRVLVLSADVGEGHVAAARALTEGLRELETVEVVERDGLCVFGVVLRHLIRDGYRWQLRWAPWSYDALYWLITHLRPARAFGAMVLATAGQRRLRRLVHGEDPDVVVSTHPALTSVLGHMRLRRRLAVPVCAAITDLADYSFWSHRGADLHLVMHESAIASVERLAGAGSATLVRPLVAARFLIGADRGVARARLDLPAAGRVVVVSGGGWGVGDLAGAVDVALAIDETTVVALAARNEQLRAALEERFAGDSRVRVWGFTERMHELLAAADVAIHSTGGMTSLEALSCGCPLIAFGSSIGHIRVHNRTMAALGLITVAGTRAELATALQRTLVDAPAHHALPADASSDAAAAVVDVRPRVRPTPRWRIVAGHGFACLACAAAVLAGLSTDDAYSLAARPFELRPITHVATTQPDVAVIVRAQPGTVGRLARALAAHGIHATFALPYPATAGLRRGLGTIGDETLPELGPGRRVRWLDTREQLRGAARVGADRRYLVPVSGLGLGQYLLARSADASPVAGRWSFDASRPLPARPSAGDIVVLSAGSADAGALGAFASLRADGLTAVPLSALLASSSTSARTARAVVSTTAPAITTASPATMPTAPSGA
ncbi:MAG: processive 1,2-diacylglycerol beta-glucosyltransferase [Solirubrobacteraceae bacterium]